MQLIFDFDGTLVDSFDSVVKIFNILAEEFSFKKISVTELDDLKELNSKELVKHLKIPLYKIPMVLINARKYLNGEIPRLASFLTLPQVLQQLHDANYSLGIISSNSLHNVTTWLDLNNMCSLFDFIHTDSSYFGKQRIINKILKQYDADKTQTFYIGDEARDIEAAKQSGINSIAVTWGFNSEKLLLQHKPHFIARKPEDLLMICGLK